MSLRNLLAIGVLLLAPAVACSASDIAVLRNGFSIPHESREAIGTMTRLYTAIDKSSYVDIPTDQIERFEKDLTPKLGPQQVSVPPMASPNLKEVIQGASDKQLLDVDLVNSVIRAESGFNTHAVSPKGARGLMQLMPDTASTLGVSNSFDPKANVEGGTQYLRWLLDRYNYDLAKALAAYNAGPHRVEQYHGIPPYAETRAYVARIIRDFNRQKLAERKALAATTKKNKPSAPGHGFAKNTEQASGSN
ncbi:MAG TPA: lytic transglycosylase domain-containing protein [Terriglobales bacterium]